MLLLRFFISGLELNFCLLSALLCDACSSCLILRALVFCRGSRHHDADCSSCSPDDACSHFHLLDANCFHLSWSYFKDKEKTMTPLTIRKKQRCGKSYNTDKNYMYRQVKTKNKRMTRLVGVKKKCGAIILCAYRRTSCDRVPEVSTLSSSGIRVRADIDYGCSCGINPVLLLSHYSITVISILSYYTCSLLSLAFRCSTIRVPCSLFSVLSSVRVFAVLTLVTAPTCHVCCMQRYIGSCS
jgi:hypothetical protein